MKFNVGERYKVGEGLFETGSVIEITEMYPIDKSKRFKYKTISGKSAYCSSFNIDSIFAKSLIPVPIDNKIVITADGKSTLARLYEGDKVIKRAEAKCAPEDTYDFRKRAELAYNRLTYGTDYHPSEVAIKVADKPEPKPEPVRLYCVKDEPHDNTLQWFIAGKTYERYGVDRVSTEQGEMPWCSWMPKYLVPLVKRPAKVGEWVYLLLDDCMHINEKGSITKYMGNGFIYDPTGRFAERGISALPESEYFLVLDGYQPEPEYYSGKVIFTHANFPDNDDFFTVGKVYTVKDGFIKSNTGNVFNLHSPVKDIEELNRVCKIGSFIKYEGEA